MKRIIPFLLLASLLLVPASGQAQIFGDKKRQQQTIEELMHRLDSLQQAYDSLYNEYQMLSAPANDTDGDILIDDDIENLVEYNSDNIDSLLNLYYIQKQIDVNEFDVATLELDSLTSNIPDEVYIERLKNMNSFIPVQFNKAVKNAIIRYTERMPMATSRIIGLSTYYMPLFEEIFDEYGLPQELKAMAVIESALNPRAVSRARAKGMWQFMYNTGKMYGLEMTSYVDERYDPLTSCRAAARLLKDSYMIFGDWSLAIASYNCGAGNVSKAIRRSGGKTDFWEIYNYLPRETRGYIPAFIAALYTLNYYPEHGIVPTQVSLPAHVDTFHVNKNLHFGQISETIGIPMETLRDLNPQYLHDIIPGTEHTYILNLPHQYTLAYVDVQDTLYRYKDSVFFNPVAVQKIKETGGTGEQRVIHKVRSGETLSSIASKHRTTVANIKRWNNLKGNTIHVGQRLYIYGPAGKPSTSTTASAKNTGSSASSGKSSGQTTAATSTYTVKKGDTLSGIAKKTGVSLNTIYKLNGMNAKSKIYPGMKIRTK
ncbi:MAG: LysM peptidoglycan-binding domain-containing protein [Bacteroidales bacterium]|nr:LysM peptidoglycan-binding domain-containing protein [Bacteroidales bacterium]